MSAMARLVRYLSRLGVGYRDSGARVVTFHADNRVYYANGRPPASLSTAAPGGAGTAALDGEAVGLGPEMVLVMSGLWPGLVAPMTAEAAALLAVGALHLTANGLPTAEPRRLLAPPVPAQLAPQKLPTGAGAPEAQEVIVRKEGE